MTTLATLTTGLGSTTPKGQPSLRGSDLDELIHEDLMCDAVNARDDGIARLDALKRGNIFVVPLDDQRRWNCYHHLFADVLPRVNKRPRYSAGSMHSPTS